jgi:hypothetical protein
MKIQILVAMVGAGSSACVLDYAVGKNPPGQGGADDSLQTSSGGELTSTATSGLTGEPDSSTGEPDGVFTCPEGQPHLAPMWATDVPLDQFFRVWTPIGGLSDGRLVMSGYDDLGGQILWFDGDGQMVGGTIALGPNEIVEHNFSVQVASDDSVVAIGSDGFDRTFVSRTLPDGVAPGHVELDSHAIASVSEFRLVSDDVVALGVTHEDFSPRLVRADIASGATVWERSLPIGEVWSTGALKLAVGPGEEVVAAYGDFSAKTGYKAWRVDNATGQTLWEIAPPMPEDDQGWLADVIVTADGVVLLVGQHNRPEAYVDVSAWGLTDGAPLWSTVIAVDDAQGSPMVEQALIFGADVLLPVGRVTNYFNTYEPGPVSASLVRLSSSGQVLANEPLALPGLASGTPGFKGVIDPCDGLVLFHAREADPWLFSFAP